jgi:4-aminobutyrate aminotransferase-like enzyme
MSKQELIARRSKTLGPTYQNFYDEPLHLVRGSGTALWDADGRSRWGTAIRTWLKRCATRRRR